MSESVISTDSDVGMIDVIELINKLQDVVSAANLPPDVLDLPQMAVVGEQSSGKSSVLENIVGRDFLPRGTGIVTRCPLVLQLVHTDNEDYAEFLHLKGQKFRNYTEVKREIQAETDRQAGSKKAISSKPISLKIHSPDVPHLTLVDLPGLTKNPVDDQPGNIEEIIRELCLQYIQPENTLILAVTSATQDLVNSDALRMALTVDPHGLRTIGIITKLDLMDSGTNARATLENKVIFLKRGYVGLVNRSQEDIDKKLDMKLAQKREHLFYKTQKAYRDMANRMGSKYLREKLSQELCQHIKNRLPSMRAQVRKENHKIKKNLDAMSAFEQQLDEHWMQSKTVELIQKFAEEFQKQLQGQSIDVTGDTLTGGARLNDCFYQEIYSLLNQAVVLDRKELFVLWRNMVGFQNMMFFTQQAFNNIVKKLVQQYKEPLVIATNAAVNIIKESVNDSTHKISAYPYLTQEVIRLMTEEITKNEEDTKEQLKCHLKAQKAFINSYHPDFMKQEELFNQSLPDEQDSLTMDTPELRRAHSMTSILDDESIMGDDLFNKRNEIMTGRINIHYTFNKRPYYFIMTTNKLTWFNDERDTRPKGSVPLDDLQFSIIQSRERTKKYNLISSKKNIKHIISFLTTEDEEDWLDAFHSVDIILTKADVPASPKRLAPEPPRRDHSASPTMRHRNQNSQYESDNIANKKVESSSRMVPVKSSDPRNDFANDPVLGEVMIKLESYMRIIDETVHDLTPKYISYFLISKTLKYAKLKLLSDVQKEDSANLLRLSDDEMSKRDEYFRVFNTTKEALQIMGEITNFEGERKKKKKKCTSSKIKNEDHDLDNDYD